MNPKQASTQKPIHNLLAERWSSRAFDSERPVEAEKIQALLEAARWAPSCFNNQPWRFILFNRHKNEAGWQNAVALLAEKNQRWARQAPVLLLVCANGFFDHNNNENRWAEYDVGAASMALSLQATALELCSHQMGGFDVSAARSKFEIPESVTPMVMIALGYQGKIETLDDVFVEQERATRARKPVADVVFEDGWSQTPARTGATY